ncbi:MAG: hypothetical protein ACRCUE_11220 [Bosea sp. (in: a-proteobacteria)]
MTKPDRLVAAEVLSTDYLNHFAEALMLIEAVAFDDSVKAELENWRPIGYREHFRTSSLRCAPHALIAYEALHPDARGAFEALCSAMERLVHTVLLTLAEVHNPEHMFPIVEITAKAFRSMLTRATAFINSGGDMEKAAYDVVALQDTIDQLMEL